MKSSTQPYDATSKRIVNQDPAAFGRLFDIDIPANARPGPTELNLSRVHADRRNADLVLTGEDRVVHLEFQSRADATMADRMLIYRSLLRVEAPYAGKRIHQHVIVLGSGTSPSRIDEPPDLMFVFDTHYARNVDPATALSHPLTAPWAVLASARDDAERARRLAQALRAVGSAGSQALARDLTRNALAFAAVVLVRQDIERVLKESGMPADLIRDTEFAKELIAEGRVEARVSSTRAILLRRGIDNDQATTIATALVHQHGDTAAERAAFDNLEDLAALATPPGAE